jgi:hypothetical protein
VRTREIGDALVAAKAVPATRKQFVVLQAAVLAAEVRSLPPQLGRPATGEQACYLQKGPPTAGNCKFTGV